MTTTRSPSLDLVAAYASSVLALLCAACGHAGLAEGDALMRQNKPAEAMGAYNSVLQSRTAESWDKDNAKDKWKEAWTLGHAQDRARVVAEVAELDRAALAPSEARLRVIALRAKLQPFARVETELGTLNDILLRASEAEWKQVEIDARAERYVAAEERASTILAAPGLPPSFASRTLALRQRAAQRYEERARRAEAYPLSRAMYRALSEHFRGKAITKEPQLASEAQARVTLELQSSPACANTVAALGKALGVADAALPVTLRLQLACASTFSDEVKQESATYYVTEPAGTRQETYYVESQKCESYPFCAPAVVTAAGGSQYVVTQCRQEVRCTPTMIPQTREVPAFKSVPQTEAYARTFRKYRAELRGALAPAEGQGGRAVRIELGASESDEQYDRPQGSKTTRDRRAFKPGLSTASMLASLDPALANLAQGLVANMLRERGDSLLIAAPADELERDEVFLRAALLGSERATANVKSAHGLDRTRMLSLLGGTDPIPRNAESPPGPRSEKQSDVPPEPSVASGYPGYERGFRGQLVLGTLAAPSVPAATAGPALAGETALLVGARLESPLLGEGAPKGFQFQDSASLLVGLGGRTSSDVLGPDQSGFGILLDADYSAFVGVRVRQLGLLGGMKARGLFGFTGEITTGLAYQVPFCGRAEVRFVENLMPTVTACAFSVLGGKLTSVELFAPLSKAGGVHLFGRYETFQADAELGAYRFGFSDPTSIAFESMMVGLGFGK
jgi:hypothetical protein